MVNSISLHVSILYMLHQQNCMTMEQVDMVVEQMLHNPQNFVNE
jgi:hypothetical protein